jgi:hypothetical protein
MRRMRGFSVIQDITPTIDSHRSSAAELHPQDGPLASIMCVSTASLASRSLREEKGLPSVIATRQFEGMIASTPLTESRLP